MESFQILWSRHVTINQPSGYQIITEGNGTKVKYIAPIKFEPVPSQSNSSTNITAIFDPVKLNKPNQNRIAK